MQDYGQQHKSAGICLDGEVNKVAGEPLHVENKDYKDSNEEVVTTDTGEAIGKVNDCGEDCNIDVEGAGENMEIDEKKEFRDENSENLEINEVEEEKENLKDNKLLHQSAEDSLGVEVNKPSCGPLHVVKQDAVEAKDEFETIDAKEVIDKVNDIGRRTVIEKMLCSLWKLMKRKNLEMITIQI
ncbi:hypothetical protein HPP92_013581 [Vanilla planifolia]|uniref:Uncharacterized protein n=1 Tax=Vanilla planifolia TaxID=51239 RepID=A0A835R286_VANPL|nr:hypothetical protein HPP92_013581 [Vanilla planifolia]